MISQEEKIARSLATPSTGGTSSPTTGGSNHDEDNEEQDKAFQKPRVLLRESIRQKFYITSSYLNSIWYSYFGNLLVFTIESYW